MRIDIIVNASIIVPTLNAAHELTALHRALIRQTRHPHEIILIDSSSDDGTPLLGAEYGWTVHVIPRPTFDHGGTRNLGASLATGELLVFLSQDALPADDCWLARLVEPIEKGVAVAVYSRQVARTSASHSEKYARLANYPVESSVRTIGKVRAEGIRALFYSNVSSATSREAFEAVGGFPTRTIMNEDGQYASKLLEAGHAVAYEAESCVLHSHDYSVSLQFRRNFDIGVSHAEARGLLTTAATSRAGIAFVLGQLRYVYRHGSLFEVAKVVVESGVKFLGYHLGRKHRILPSPVRRWLSWQRDYWR